MKAFRNTGLFFGLLLSLSSSAFAANTYTRISSPQEGDSFTPGSRISVTASARDPDGIGVARLWVNGKYYGVDSRAPYTFNVTGLSEGSHSLMVRTKDKKGNALNSQTIQILVEKTRRPSASITFPTNGSSITEGESITVRAEAYDSDGLNAARLWVNGEYFGIDKTSPYSFNVSGLTQGNHTLMVRTRDSKGNSFDTSPISISVKSASYARISSPSSGFVLPSGSILSVTANAFDSDGINAARLWVDGQYYGVDTSAPYQFNVADLAVGNHSLMVRTKDNLGNLLDSSAVSVSVVAPAYTTITSPQSGLAIAAGDLLTVTAEAYDSDGISAARLWVDGQYYGIDNSAPYTFMVTDLAEGNHTLMVRTKDNEGYLLDSNTVTVSVEAVQQAYAMITSPSSGFVITAGESMAVTADAFDPDGIQAVRLWLDGNYHSIDSSAPYNFTVNGLAEGTHTLMVRSKSSTNKLLDSQSIAVTVQAREDDGDDDQGDGSDDNGYARITAPANDSEIAEGVPITVAAEAFDPDGIDAVRLWVDGNYYSIDNTAPYTFNVTGLTSGDHTLMVRARDSQGDALDSEVVAITVTKFEEAYSTITSPVPGAVLPSGESITVTADAFDPDGVKAVRLWVNNNYHSVDVSEPYSFTVDTLSPGTHTLKVRAQSENNNLLDSELITVNIEASNEDSDDGDGTGDDGDGDNGGGSNDDAVKMPIEVFGPSGTQKSVTFELDDTSNISHLYLRCNACGYHDIDFDKNTSKVKATVRINNGAAIPLKHFVERDRVYGNQQVKIIGGEASYGGIGGGFRTVRLMVPVSGLVTGTNTLTFEHRNAEAPSIGFRIIELNLLKSGSVNQKVLSEQSFIEDDPATWVAPRNTENDIAQGRRLWTQRNHLYDVWLDGLDGKGNRQGPLNGTMRASCADCHAEDGRDLKYFNFTNESIVERSKFHGLSQKDGEQIASYIRDLSIPIVEQARPWHPAYQPGPGLDERPTYEWAAGAGVDAILDQDKDIEPYLFPNGTSLNNVRAVVDRYETLNFRELPINLAMPEWNQWLPIIHPDDAFDIDATAIVSDHRGKRVGIPFYKKLYNDALASPNRSTIGQMTFNLKSWLRRDLVCSNGGIKNGEPMRALNGAVLDAIRLPAIKVTRSNCDSVRETSAVKPYEIAKRGLTGWASVKMWEILHSNDMEQDSQKMTQRVCSDGRCIDASEARGWVVDGRNVFDRAPHFIGAGKGRRFLSQNSMLGVFESNTWYHLNMILNPGYRETMPSHFAYTYSHVELLQQEARVAQGFRFWATMIKQRQLQTNGKYGVEAGLDLRTAQPYVYYGTARNKTKTDTQRSIGQPLWGRLAQAMVEDFVEDANNATANDWARANQNRKVQPRNSTDFSDCNGTCTFDLGPLQGRNTYRVIPKLREIGVSNAVIDDLIDWGQKTWPNGPWNRVRNE